MKHLTYNDRLKIEWCYAHGITRKADIAKEIPCSLSTIYHEFQRDCWYVYTDRYLLEHIRYSADKAQNDYDWKNSIRGQHDKLGNHWEFINFIETEMLQHHNLSLYSALCRWNVYRKQHDIAFTVSLKTLYRYIDSGLYFPHLTNKHLPEKCKQKQKKNRVRRAKRPPAGISIEKRPVVVSNRTEFGHWEMDSIIGKSEGKKESILTLVERLTRFQIVIKVSSKTAASTVNALRKLSRRCDFPRLFKSITVDNGSEFQDFKAMQSLGTAIYYCHPGTSCERASNERHNGLLRYFFPKGKSLSKVTDADCRHAARYYNDLERRLFDGHTSRQLFEYYTSKENISNKISDFY